MQRPGAPDLNSGRVFFEILNGQKLLVGSSNAPIDIKPADKIDTKDDALWELIRNSDGYYSIKNRSTGQYIVRDSANAVKTSQSAGEKGKWQVTLASSLSVDNCKVYMKPKDPSETILTWGNQDGTLVLAINKTSLEVTQQADQLFKLAYADGEDWS